MGLSFLLCKHRCFRLDVFSRSLDSGCKIRYLQTPTYHFQTNKVSGLNWLTVLGSIYFKPSLCSKTAHRRPFQAALTYSLPDVKTWRLGMLYRYCFSVELTCLGAVSSCSFPQDHFLLLKPCWAIIIIRWFAS
jgi:hypothetical protein